MGRPSAPRPCVSVRTPSLAWAALPCSWCLRGGCPGLRGGLTLGWRGQGSQPGPLLPGVLPQAEVGWLRATGFWFGGQSRCVRREVAGGGPGGTLSPLCPGGVCRASQHLGGRRGTGRESETSLPGPRRALPGVGQRQPHSASARPAARPSQSRRVCPGISGTPRLPCCPRSGGQAPAGWERQHLPWRR